ncbi:ABC transporter permease [Desulfopila sp. IMCC35008]|uniref:ABC transporter permease n=1 Tax=Desulfopila sp. IMCC35008 TaxID=2653858 RepID=UPI0013D8105D|nr:FtsX-like permease family protein [Desulfopila sp. IMCC35008]
MNLRFLSREMWASRGQAFIFTLCTALSITMLVAVSSFTRDIETSIIGDGQALHGGDIILRSNYPLSAQLLQAAAKVQPDEQARVRTWRFYSVVRAENDATLFANIMAVGRAYPLYGAVDLQSGRALRSKLRPGYAVVEDSLLQRLNLELGDTLHVGNHALQIADIIVAESSRPIQLVNLGPRILISEPDLEKTGLVKSGSRVRYGLRIKVDKASSLEKMVQILRDAAVSGSERVETYRSANSGLKRFFDNLLFFLSLIAVFTLLLAGAGMQSSLSALLNQREKSLAIVRTLGGSSRFLLVHYGALVLFFGFLGSLLGIGLGVALKFGLPLVVGDLVGAESLTGLSLADITMGLGLGLLATLFFTFLPLYRLRGIKPNGIFRKTAESVHKGMGYYFFMAIGLILLAVLVVGQLKDVRSGLYFLVGAGGLIVVVALFTHLLFTLLRRLDNGPLLVRLALRSLLRTGNRSGAVIVTLSSALAILLVIFLVRYNLQATFVESYPDDAPNVFLVDIQDEQRDGVRVLVGGELELHPIIRARLKAINGERVKGGEKKRFRDSLSREFNMTYRDDLLQDEVLEEGNSLFGDVRGADAPVPVSILDSVAEMGDMEKGDLLEFNIQGVELTAEVTSIRSRNRSMLYPFFYFVFPTRVLDKAPKTFFGALHAKETSIGKMQSEIVSKYPNVSLINMARAASEIGSIMEKLARVINFLALFSMSAGALILMSSIVATRFARLREAVYYKILGGGARFVLSVFLTENLILGLVSVFLGIVLAQIGGWGICTYFFDIGYDSHWVSSLLLAVATLVVVSVVGTAGCVNIIRQKPASFLREQSVE